MEESLRGLQSVRIRRKDLLEKLEYNRDGHRAVFEEAIEGYHQAVIKALQDALRDAKAGKKYRPEIFLPEPADHTSDYDRAIAMLKMSLDEELVLSNVEFAQYALDDWGWKRDFIATANTYTDTQR